MKAPYQLGRYDLYAGQTPEQTVGPFFSQGLVRPAAPGVLGPRLCDADTPGERLRLQGTVYDGLARPIPDAMLEIWQADSQGRYVHPLQSGERARETGFRGFGRAATDADGRYAFETIRPGAVPGPRGSAQAAHINLVLGARGMPRFAFTRIYFADDPAIASDPVLALVPPKRLETLLAQPELESTGRRSHRFDLHLQGELETVFFDF